MLSPLFFFFFSFFTLSLPFFLFFVFTHLIPCILTPLRTPPAMITSPMNDATNSSHGPPHAPHTSPDPRIQIKPEYAPSHSEHHRPDHTPSATTTNSPHTTPLHYDSPSPNPQTGPAQLSFIPTPTSQPCAPALDTTIPMANDDSKYEISGPMPYHVPLSVPAPDPSSPYPAPPYSDNQVHQPQQKQQPHNENVTIADATPIDMKKENYKLSPAAGGSTILDDLRNPRKKIFWVFTIIALAIFFGVLAATVWKPKSDETSGGGINPNAITPMSQDTFACLSACSQAIAGCNPSCGGDPTSDCFQKCTSTLSSCVGRCRMQG